MANRNADVNNPARIRAEILAAMFEHSQIDPTGFDPARSREDRRRRRAEIHAEIDGLLDEWAISRLLLALEHATTE